MCVHTEGVHPGPAVCATMRRSPAPGSLVRLDPKIVDGDDYLGDRSAARREGMGGHGGDEEV